VTTAEPPSFDLVVATVDRTDELGRLLSSLEAQTHRNFRVLLVDQNEDARVSQILNDHPVLDVTLLHSPRGLSRARNVALGEVRAALVAFPDDDCVLPPDLLQRVAQRFEGDQQLDGLTGRAVDGSGVSSSSWSRTGAVLTRENLWNRAISFTIFLRASAVRQFGEFDEQLGLGSSTPWSSGEETDYLVRAVDAGARIEYDPELVVVHESKPLSAADLRALGSREGASVGYILRKHGYPIRTVSRMLIRPAGGIALALAQRNAARAGFQLATLRGRLRGYRAA
jgi:GT2 family glycosyltransferase